MFQANYHYLLVIVSGAGGALPSILWRSCLSRLNSITSIHQSINNNQKRLLKKWQYHASTKIKGMEIQHWKLLLVSVISIWEHLIFNIQKAEENYLCKAVSFFYVNTETLRWL